MDHLAKRTIQLAMKEGDQPITDKTLLSQFEIAIEDIEGDFKILEHTTYNTLCKSINLNYTFTTTSTCIQYSILFYTVCV
jgi:hypothetical protein